jgi:heterodisulfide reductase subunit A-like polyferredoxin
MVNIKILLCNCKGLCPSFKDSDMDTLPFLVESELDVQYTVVHPQLCGQGGNAVLTDILRQAAADPETYVVAGACAPNAQFKLFKKVLRTSGFDEKRFVPLDIRGTFNEGILARLKEVVEGLVAKHAQTVSEQAAA